MASSTSLTISTWSTLPLFVSGN